MSTIEGKVQPYKRNKKSYKKGKTTLKRLNQQLRTLAREVHSTEWKHLFFNSIPGSSSSLALAWNILNDWGTLVLPMTWISSGPGSVNEMVGRVIQPKFLQMRFSFQQYAQQNQAITDVYPNQPVRIIFIQVKGASPPGISTPGSSLPLVLFDNAAAMPTIAALGRDFGGKHKQFHVLYDEVINLRNEPSSVISSASPPIDNPVQKSNPVTHVVKLDMTKLNPITFQNTPPNTAVPVYTTGYTGQPNTDDGAIHGFILNDWPAIDSTTYQPMGVIWSGDFVYTDA